MIQLGLVVSQFNKRDPVTQEMAELARVAVDEHDATLVETVEVPGSYDTPLAADRLARRDDIDAVAVLGAIVTGDTDHDQIIGHAVADRLVAVSLDRDTPVTFGVTGPGMSADEALARVESGREAVESAVALVGELDGVSDPAPVRGPAADTAETSEDHP